jgi:hypothetical protein
MPGTACTALEVLRARVIHEDTTHDLGRHREKMGAVLPPHAGIADEPQVGFVDESGRLKPVAGPLAPHVPPDRPVQLVVHVRSRSTPTGYSSTRAGSSRSPSCRMKRSHSFGSMLTAPSGTIEQRRTDATFRGPSTIDRAGNFYLVVNADVETGTIPFTVSVVPRRPVDRSWR